MEDSTMAARRSFSLVRPEIRESAHVREAKDIAACIGERDNPAMVNWSLRLIEERDAWARGPVRRDAGMRR
jgi:hypothetical protein